MRLTRKDQQTLHVWLNTGDCFRPDPAIRARFMTETCPHIEHLLQRSSSGELTSPRLGLRRRTSNTLPARIRACYAL